MPIKGDAGFTYGAGPTTHALAAPIRIESYRDLSRRFTRESLDRTTIDRTTIGAGVTEILARIPYEDSPAALIAMLKDAANNGTEMDYFPSLADTLTSYAFTLTPEMGDAIELVPDSQMGRWSKRWEITVRLRTSDDISALIES